MIYGIEARLVASAAAVLVLFGAGFGVAWKWRSGQVEKARHQVERMEWALADRDQLVEDLRQRHAAILEQLDTAAAAAQEADARYREALARTPEEVIRYRTIREEVPVLIEAEACVDQVGQMVKLLQAAVVVP